MPLPRKTPVEWLDRQVGFVSAWGDAISQIDPDIHHDYDVHTALKLAALNYAIGVFSPIARSQVQQQIYAAAVYLDLFAGCGATLTRGVDFLAGSPIIAAHARPAFDKIVCIEKDPAYAATLEKRLRSVAPGRSVVITGDCNNSVQAILTEIPKRSIILTVVDPEGMEIHWDTLRAIAAASPAMDFFINLTTGAQRELGAVVATGKSSQRIEDFTGLSIRQVLLNETGEISTVYEEQIRSVLGKQIGDSSLIVGADGHARYRILIYARRTLRGSPWAKGYSDIHGRLEHLGANHALGALNKIKGRALGSGY